MYKIRKAEKLNEIVYLMVVEAPMVAKHNDDTGVEGKPKFRMK